MALVTSVLTGGTNEHETTSAEVNGVATDFVTPGVVGAFTSDDSAGPMTGALAVNEQSPQAMAVDISTGIAYVTATPTGQSSQTFRVNVNETTEVTIAENSSGSSKYDWIYLKIDPANAANPNTAGDNVASFVVSRSTSETSDDGTPPTYGLLIAKVLVFNGASYIENGDLIDARLRAVPVPEWTEFTPNWTNLTVGNATEEAYWRQVGNTIQVRGRINLGSTSSVSTAPRFDLPVIPTSDFTVTGTLGGMCTFYDNDADNMYAGAVYIASSDAFLRCNYSTTTPPAPIEVVQLTSAFPFTWTTNDDIYYRFEYEVA